MTQAMKIDIAAVVISLAALLLAAIVGVYTIKHTKVAHRPHLDISLLAKGIADDHGFVLTNDGLGPAHIKRMYLMVDKKPVVPDPCDGNKHADASDKRWNRVWFIASKMVGVKTTLNLDAEPAPPTCEKSNAGIASSTDIAQQGLLSAASPDSILPIDSTSPTEIVSFIYYPPNSTVMQGAKRYLMRVGPAKGEVKGQLDDSQYVRLKRVSIQIDYESAFGEECSITYSPIEADPYKRQVCKTDWWAL